MAGLMKATTDTLARQAVVQLHMGSLPVAKVYVEAGYAVSRVAALRFGTRALDKVVAYARREGLFVLRVDVFDQEGGSMTREDALRRARSHWGDGVVDVTRVADAPSRAGTDWIEWTVDVAGDHRTHALDGDGRIACKHADCRIAAEGAGR